MLCHIKTEAWFNCTISNDAHGEGWLSFSRKRNLFHFSFCTTQILLSCPVSAFTPGFCRNNFHSRKVGKALNTHRYILCVVVEGIWKRLQLWQLFIGKLSQIWVGGVSDSQTDPKRNLKSPFLTNFTLCVSKSHKKTLVGFKYLRKFRKKRFWEPSLKGNVLTCVITSSSLFPASSLLRIHGKWTIILVKLYEIHIYSYHELPLLEVIDY